MCLAALAALSWIRYLGSVGLKELLNLVTFGLGYSLCLGRYCTVPTYLPTEMIPTREVAWRTGGGLAGWRAGGLEGLGGRVSASAWKAPRAQITLLPSTPARASTGRAASMAPSRPQVWAARGHRQPSSRAPA